MESLLLWESLSFVINLLGVLVFVSMSWLFFDATNVRKQINVWLSGLGSLVVAGSFCLGIVGLELWQNYLVVSGFLLIALGAWTKPMSKRPRIEKINDE